MKQICDNKTASLHFREPRWGGSRPLPGRLAFLQSSAAGLVVSSTPGARLKDLPAKSSFTGLPQVESVLPDAWWCIASDSIPYPTNSYLPSWPVFELPEGTGLSPWWPPNLTRPVEVNKEGRGSMSVQA